MADGVVLIQEPIVFTKRLDTEELTVSGTIVERERVQISGSIAAEVARVINTAPVSTEYGVVVRPIEPYTLGQKTLATSIPVAIASDQSAIPVISNPNFRAQADTFTTTGVGITVNVSTAPVKSYSLEVKGTGGAASSWDVRLEGSLDNINFTTILQHTNATGDGLLVFSEQNLRPALYFRSRVAGLVLGLATNIVVTILGQ